MAKRKSTKRAGGFEPKGRNGKPCGLCKRIGKRCRWHLVGAQKAHSRARARGQDAFLLAFAKAATVTRAARAAGLGRRTHYNWMATDPEYADRFEDAAAGHDTDRGEPMGEPASFTNLHVDARR